MAKSPVTLADDFSQPFQVDKQGVRGRFVRLGPAADEIIGRHGYPDTVSFVLAEMLALAATLATALKFDGIFTLQIRSDGPVSVLVADFESPGQMRAYAKYDAEAVAALVARAGRSDIGITELLGSGYFSWTVDHRLDADRYQGIVALTGKTLAECAEHYFEQSEQLRAAIKLAVAREMSPDGTYRWRTAGMMVQNLASEGGTPRDEDVKTVDPADWEHVLALFRTLTEAELVDPSLPAQRLLYRLFHEDGVWVYDALPLVAACRCSRDKVIGVLNTFSPPELAGMATDGAIEAGCEFCNRTYSFAETELKPAVS